jgi:hypothetical protein
VQIPETEAEIYSYITKDGSSTEAIRQNTRMLRDLFLQEKERRIHALTTYDPYSKDRHEGEAEGIHEERSRKLGNVLMEIANMSSQQLPMHKEEFIKTSQKVGMPRTHIKAWAAFPALLIVASPILAFITGVSYVVVVMVRGPVGMIIGAVLFIGGVWMTIGMIRESMQNIRDGESAIGTVFGILFRFVGAILGGGSDRR